jgi:hypothetical protein
MSDCSSSSGGLHKFRYYKYSDKINRTILLGIF